MSRPSPCCRSSSTQAPPFSSTTAPTTWSIHDFDLGKAIGKGRFGNVYCCKDKRSGKQVALKVLFKQELEACGVVRQLKREIEVHCRLRHPNVVRCYGFFVDPHRVYVVMALAQGGDLHRYLRAQPGRRLAEPLAAFYVKQLLDALRYLHGQGIIHRYGSFSTRPPSPVQHRTKTAFFFFVHPPTHPHTHARDLKPENLLLDARGHLLLCDFGWCTSSKRLRQTVCGTQGDYLAPEVLAREPYGPSVDLWTAGVLAYELMHGKTPFGRSFSDDESSEEDEDEEDLCDRGQRIRFSDDISDEACDFIMQVLVTEPARRPTLAQAAAHCWLDEENVSPPTVLPVQIVPNTPSSTSSPSSSSSFSSSSSSLTSAPHRAVIPPLEQRDLSLTPSALSSSSSSSSSTPTSTKKCWSIADFEVGKAIGKGRYGSVYMCKEKATGQVIALKILFKAQLEADGVMHQVIHLSPPPTRLLTWGYTALQ